MTVKPPLPKPAHKPVLFHRLQFRATPAQRRVIRHAAAAGGVSVNAYILDTVCAAAYERVAERLDIPLDDPDWDHFLELLGQPTSSRDELRTLLCDGP